MDVQQIKKNFVDLESKYRKNMTEIWNKYKMNPKKYQRETKIKECVKIDQGKVPFLNLSNAQDENKRLFFSGLPSQMIMTKMGNLQSDANVFHSVRRQLGVLFTDVLCND